VAKNCIDTASKGGVCKDNVESKNRMIATQLRTMKTIKDGDSKLLAQAHGIAHACLPDFTEKT
jgi:hypothetical protein